MAWKTRTKTKFVPRPDGAFKDGAVPGDRVEVDEVVYEDDSPQSFTSGPPTESIELGSAGKKFVGFGMILLGLWTAPGSDAPGGRWLIPGALLALGLLGLIKGTVESWGCGWHPFADRRGFSGGLLRFFWAFRPRAYMWIWAAIIIGFMTIGTPHLRIFYGPSGCDYFGLNGWESFGVGGSCPLVKMFVLR
ncbi:MAG: hypothetical protein AAGA50_14235 [Pseudomonadota bacterium]